MKTNLIPRFAALVLATCSCLPALADSPLPSMTVSYADLNLRSPEGIAALYKRIRHAAVEVCDMPQRTRQLYIETEIKACRIDATEGAIARADLPRLGALHLARTGRSVGSGQYAKRQ